MALANELDVVLCKATLVRGHSRGRTVVEGVSEHRGQGASVQMSHLAFERAPLDTVFRKLEGHTDAEDARANIIATSIALRAPRGDEVR